MFHVIQNKICDAGKKITSKSLSKMHIDKRHFRKYFVTNKKSLTEYSKRTFYVLLSKTCVHVDLQNKIYVTEKEK